MNSNEIALEQLLKMASYGSYENTGEQYRAYDFAISALKMRIPKTPTINKNMLQCPTCKRNLTLKNCIKKMYDFCPKCGQAINWNGYKIASRVENNIDTFEFKVRVWDA